MISNRHSLSLPEQLSAEGREEYDLALGVFTAHRKHRYQISIKQQSGDEHDYPERESRVDEFDRKMRSLIGTKPLAMRVVIWPYHNGRGTKGEAQEFKFIFEHNSLNGVDRFGLPKMQPTGSSDDVVLKQHLGEIERRFLEAENKRDYAELERERNEGMEKQKLNYEHRIERMQDQHNLQMRDLTQENTSLKRELSEARQNLLIQADEHRRKNWRLDNIVRKGCQALTGFAIPILQQHAPQSVGKVVSILNGIASMAGDDSDEMESGKRGSYADDEQLPSAAMSGSDDDVIEFPLSNEVLDMLQQQFDAQTIEVLEGLIAMVAMAPQLERLGLLELAINTIARRQQPQAHTAVHEQPECQPERQGKRYFSFHRSGQSPHSADDPNDELPKQ